MKLRGFRNGGHCLHARPFPWSKQVARCCRCGWRTNQFWARGIVPFSVPMEGPICPKEPRGEWRRDGLAVLEISYKLGLDPWTAKPDPRSFRCGET